MAKFEIQEVEGMRQVGARIDDETIRAVAGALSHMEGRIKMTASLPSIRDLLRTIISKEARVRPRYTGTGSVHLEPSMGGFHIFEAHEERWILEPGVFWACEGDVMLGLRREPFLASLWGGDGLFKIQTTVQGDGEVVVKAPGPVEEIEVDGELVVQGRLVLGRTDGLRYRVRRATSFLQSFISGEPLVRTYSGKGRALVCWTPYWNHYIHEMMTADDDTVNA